MTNLMKLIETSKIISTVFDFQMKSSQKKGIRILLIIIRVLLLILSGIFLFYLHLAIYILYLFTFFTSLPGKLVKKVRMDSLGFDPENKWLFNLSYLLLYAFVLPFEFMYIFMTYIIVVLSFFTDCFTWVLTLGNTKLNCTKISMSDDNSIENVVDNYNILSILLTFITVVAFGLLNILFFITPLILQWTIVSVLLLGINAIFYHLTRLHKNPEVKVE